MIKDSINEIIRNKIIQPSTSPWSSPIVVVPKPDGTPRFCVDYRKLNAITHKDAYPLPIIEDVLSSLHGSN